MVPNASKDEVRGGVVWRWGREGWRNQHQMKIYSNGICLADDDDDVEGKGEGGGRANGWNIGI